MININKSKTKKSIGFQGENLYYSSLEPLKKAELAYV